MLLYDIIVLRKFAQIMSIKEIDIVNSGETVYISGNAKPKKVFLVYAVIYLVMSVVNIIIVSSITSRPDVELLDPSGAFMVIVVLFFGGINMVNFYFKSKKCSITVTNMRIMGKCLKYGKGDVDVPIDQVSKVILENNGDIRVKAGKSKFRFPATDNSVQIVDVINKLIRGDSVIAAQPAQPAVPVQPAMQQPVQPVIPQPVQPAIPQPVQPAMQQPLPQNIAVELKKALDLVNSGKMTIQEYEDYKSNLLSRQ